MAVGACVGHLASAEAGKKKRETSSSQVMTIICVLNTTFYSFL